jgi:hypothetical protein
MSPLNRACRALWVVTAATFLASCAPSLEPAASISQSLGTRAPHGRSWISPHAVKGNLLYVSYPESGVVLVFSYPGGTQVGEIADLPGEPDGLCSDSHGDVWVTLHGLVYEYAHGGTTRIATLEDGTLNAWACSVDPSTGDLAVASPATPSGYYGDVAIYKHGRGSPKAYKDPLFFGYSACGYDPRGNLYIMGFGGDSSYPANLFAELPKGGRKLETVTLSHTPQGQGDVQWDGQDVAVSSPEESAIYRFKIKGKLGHELGYTALTDFSTVQQFAFPNVAARKGKLAARVIGGSTQFGSVMFWDYPQGGDPTRSIGSSEGEALGVTVSIAPK